MTIAAAEKTLMKSLLLSYEDGESRAIAQLVMEKVTGLKKMDRLMAGAVQLTDSQRKLLTNYIAHLAEGRPVQYVLGEAWFANMKFAVNPDVLIPRPETEELVNWGIEFARPQVLAKQAGPEQQAANIPVRMLDIGTGSGCIAIALKKALPSVEVTACDLSERAISIASSNAKILTTPIRFIPLDILDTKQTDNLPIFDFIFSNPPYITQNESAGMPFNVVGFEPRLALFVPDSDPLLFYKAIAKLTITKLKSDGFVFVETHEDHAEEVAALFWETLHMTVEIRKDMHGKSRMVKATRLP